MFIFRWIIALLMVCLLIPWSIDILAQAWQQRNISLSHGIAIMCGLSLGVLLIFWKKPNWFIHTLIHEAAHALACLCLGVRIRNFQASDGKGGMVVHDKTGPIRSTIISLAPYTLPLILIPLFIADYFITDPTTLLIMKGVISFAFIQHLHGLYHNVRLNFWGKQADLTKAGKPLSIASITACLALVSAWCIRVLSHG